MEAQRAITPLISNEDVASTLTGSETVAVFAAAHDLLLARGGPIPRKGSGGEEVTPPRSHRDAARTQIHESGVGRFHVFS